MAFDKFAIAGAIGFAGAWLILHGATSPRNTQESDTSAISGYDLQNLTISLERGACFGNCPDYSLVVHGDGLVEYKGRSRGKETEARQGHIDVDTLRILATTFQVAKFSAIAEDYSGSNCKRYCTDMPTVTTQVTFRGKTHKVRHDYGCMDAPKILFELESAVDKAANSQQWTGDVGHAGPYGTTCSERK